MALFVLTLFECCDTEYKYPIEDDFEIDNERFAESFNDAVQTAGMQHMIEHDCGDQKVLVDIEGSGEGYEEHNAH